MNGRVVDPTSVFSDSADLVKESAVRGHARLPLAQDCPRFLIGSGRGEAFPSAVRRLDCATERHVAYHCQDVVPSQEYCRKFLNRVASPTGFDVLFDYVPDVYFFVKDRAGRFMRVNQAFSKLAQASKAEDVIGRRDPDFFPSSLAQNYMRDDQQVLVTSEAMIDKAELMRHADGSTDWFCTTKLPLFDRAGRAIGICGITRDVKRMNTTHARFLSWAPVLEMLLGDYGSPLEIPMLARKMALSVSQFNRQFKRRFHTTPRAYLTEVRLKAASHFLVTTELSMSEIALRTGFYDQSHFTNQFVKHEGVTPSKYRSAHSQDSLAAAPESSPLRSSSKELTAVSKDGLS